MVDTSKIRINDLARELEVKSKQILDTLPLVGVTEKKTHSSSITVEEAEKVRAHIRGGGDSSASSKSASRGSDFETKIDWSHVTKPGDVLKELLAKKQHATAPAPPKPEPKPIAVPPSAKPAAPVAKPATPAAPP